MHKPAEVTLPSDREVRVTRTFHAPRHRWRWRNLEDGKQFGFFGTFTEVEAPSKLVHEQYYDPGDTDFAMPEGDPCVVSLALDERDGITTLVCTLAFASKEARDAALSTGMAEGMEYSYTRLDALCEAVG